MRKVAAGVIGLCLVLVGCMTNNSGDPAYRAFIRIPLGNVIACSYDSVEVANVSDDLYSNNESRLAKISGGACLYPYTEPEIWVSYRVEIPSGRMIWGPGWLGRDSAQAAAEFFTPSNNDGPFQPNWMLRGYVGVDSSLVVEQWHLKAAASVSRVEGLVAYDRTRGGFIISGNSAIEIYVIK